MTAATIRPVFASARPLLLDTDIGTDIDDVYALICAAISPEFDLKAVTTVNNDVVLRARIARRVLNLMGREDVPVIIGAGPSLTPDEHRGWGGYEGEGIDLSSIPVPETGNSANGGSAMEGTTEGGSAKGKIENGDAPRRIAEFAQQCYEAGAPLTVCPIGAMTNLAIALREYPEQTRKIGQIIAMAADFGGYGVANARTEHNIACDPVAAQVLLQSGLPITLVGLNVTKQTAMTLEELETLEAIGGPLAHAVAGMHRVWFDHIHNTRSPMHDALTLAQQIDSAILTFAPAYCSVGTQHHDLGKVTYLEGSPIDASTQEEALLSPPCQVALSVNAPRYHALLQARVQEAVRQARDRFPAS